MGEKIEVEGLELTVETPDAYCLDGEWVPRSQCRFDEETGVAFISEWMAIEKGFV